MSDAPGLAGLLDELVLVEQDAARLAARRVRVLAAIHAAEQAQRQVEVASGGGPVGSESVAGRDRHWVSEEVGLILRVAGVTAQERLLHAYQLVTRLPETVELLEGGQLHPFHAQRLSDAVVTLTDEQCAAVQNRVLVAARTQSIAAFGRSLRRAVMACAPKTSEQAHTEALSQQRVEVRPLDDGMALLLAWLPAPEALRIKAAINTHANTTHANLTHQTGPDACHTIDQRRAVAFIDLIDLGASAAQATTEVATTGAQAAATQPSRPRVAVQVTLSLATLLGLSSEPGELAGYGPIPPSMARALACDQNGTWRRIVTDPVGRVVDYGRRVYRPPAHLDRFIRARDQICTFPNCHRQAVNCELDHVIPWDDLGETNERNLVAACARHHHLKHDAGWTNHYNPTTGTTTWISPTGHIYINPPEPYPYGETDQTLRRAS
jgi:Domain of unknown function (DUF222)/HNH endonuclease